MGKLFIIKQRVVFFFTILITSDLGNTNDTFTVHTAFLTHQGNYNRVPVTTVANDRIRNLVSSVNTVTRKYSQTNYILTTDANTSYVHNETERVEKDHVQTYTPSGSTLGYLQNNLTGQTLQMKSTETPLFGTIQTTSGLNVSELHQLDRCSDFGKCNNMSSTPFPFCQCDDLCSLYEDCCVDAPVVNTSVGSVNTTFECSPYTNRANVYDGIYIVKTCPESQSTENKIMCQMDDVLSTGPWVLSADDVVYKNKHCARCNGVKTFEAFSIKITSVTSNYIKENFNVTVPFKLQSALTQAEKQLRFSFRWEFIPPSWTRVRRCLLFDPPIQPTQKCQDNKINPVSITNFFKINIYRNQWCISTEKNFNCLGSVFDSLFHIFEQYNWFPLSIMFPFNQDKDECKNKVFGFCIGDEIYSDYNFSMFYSLISSVFLSKEQILKIFASFIWPYRHDMKPNSINIQYILEDINNTAFNTHLHFRGLITKSMTGKDMLDYEEMLQKSRWNAIVRSPKNTVYKVYITEREPNNMFMKYNETVIREEWNLNEEEFQPYLNKIKSKSLIDVVYNASCQEYFLHLEFGDEKNESGLIITRLQCLTKSSYNKDGSMNLVKHIISYSGMGASVLALTASVVVYRKTGMHNSVPGSNVENLSLALLLSNIFFMVGVGANDYQIVCYVIGVCLHYMWLVVFSFKSITLVYMCHNLRQMRVNNAHAGKSQTSKKCLTVLGLSLPLLFVFPAVIVDKFNISSISPGYGGSVCFPTGTPANFIFVSTPIGLSVAVNMFCFIFTAITILKQSAETKLIRKSSSYQYLSVFIRISVVTGVFWLTGLLGSILPNETTEYIFITMCSFQGLFVALANLTTKQIFRKILKSSSRDH